jgi:uncharacterized protein (TIGR02646 family)
VRKLRKRSEIDLGTQRRLVDATDQIFRHRFPKEEADRVYRLARQAAWFEIIVRTLRRMSGVGVRCMYCSGSEASNVEHFRPKAIFPERAMDWNNLLWVCGICNQKKGDHFPPDTEPGEMIINPVESNPWDYFFIDEFGNLTEIWRSDLNDIDPRAKSTMVHLGLGREALQLVRQERLQDLRSQISDSVELFTAGSVSKNELRIRIRRWKRQSYQPDVADYFLNGPGRTEEPFASLFRLIR